MDNDGREETINLRAEDLPRLNYGPGGIRVNNGWGGDFELALDRDGATATTIRATNATEDPQLARFFADHTNIPTYTAPIVGRYVPHMTIEDPSTVMVKYRGRYVTLQEYIDDRIAMTSEKIANELIDTILNNMKIPEEDARIFDEFMKTFK